MRDRVVSPRWVVVACWLVLAAGSARAQQRIFVDASATGADDGASWADAFTDLQSALAVPPDGCPGLPDNIVAEVWVAAGTYRPDGGSGDRGVSFELRDGVAVFGGFAGGENQLGQRDPAANPTILSGDIGAVGNDADNSFHVVDGSGNDATAILDGLVITGGNASQSAGIDSAGGGMLIDVGSPTLINCRFEANHATNHGGGLYSSGNSDPTLVNVTFVGNTSDNGAGMSVANGTPTLVGCRFFGNQATTAGGGLYNNAQGGAASGRIIANCVFSGNTATFGGGMVNVTSDADGPALSNSSFSGNTASTSGGGLFTSHFGAGASLSVANSVFWGNTDNNGANMDESAQIHTGSGIPTVDHSCVQGGWTGAGGTGNVSTDPLYKDPDGPDNTFGTEDDNLRLSSGSRCIDTGDDARVAPDAADLDGDANTGEPLPWDLVRNGRIADGDLDTVATVDMGAYEVPPAAIEPDLDNGQTVTLNPGGGQGDPFLEALVEITNTGGPNNATVSVTETRDDLPSAVGSFRGIDTAVEIVTSLADGTYFMTVMVPIDDSALPFPLAVDLMYFNVSSGMWELAAAGNTQPSPGHGGPVGDRTAQNVGSVPTLSSDLGDYGVAWNPSLMRGFVWANVDHTSEFTLGILTECNGFCDCNGNGIDDTIDLIATSEDCNGNGVPDECDVATGTSHDCNENGRDDLCEIVDKDSEDCNFNGEPDECDLAGGVSTDVDRNDRPDECDRIGTCGDLDQSGFVDLADWAAFHGLLGGPDVTASGAQEVADLDDDGDADLLDAMLFAAQIHAAPGMEPDCIPNGLTLRSFARCYLPGEMAEVVVDVPPSVTGTLRLLIVAEDEKAADIDNPLWQTTIALDGSASYPFLVTLPTDAGMYGAIGELLDDQGDRLALNGTPLGVRPDVPGIPGEICTFETFDVDDAVLRSQVEAAVTARLPFTLELGSRSFEVLLEDRNDLVDSQVLSGVPSLALYGGEISGDPDSLVAMTFVNGRAYAMLEPGGEGSVVYMDPVRQYDPSADEELYLAYRGNDVAVPLHEHTAAEQTAEALAAGLPQATGGCPVFAPRILLNLYRDFTDGGGSRFQDFHNIAETFQKRLGIIVRLNLDRRIDTDQYRDVVCDSADPNDFLEDFTCDPLTTVAGAQAALLLTRNGSNISYGSFLGCAWVRRAFYTSTPYSWVLREGSQHRVRTTACQEISHNLGASDTTSLHRNGPLDLHCHFRVAFPFVGSVCIPPRHRHYSLMRSGANPHWTDYLFGGEKILARWFFEDKVTILNTIEDNPGAFCP